MRVISSVIAKAEGAVVNVTAVCRDAGVAPKTFYKVYARYLAEGLAGIEPRSRRPHTSPGQTPVKIEERIVRLRKELADGGLDHGPKTIQWHLGRQREREHGKWTVPSPATVHRILTRRGLIIPEPRKRPNSSLRRFEAPAPNEWWQIDSTDWTIATGIVKVFNQLDDHSRVATGSRAVHSASTDEAWTSFCIAAEEWGLPAGVLSDNGLAFSGKLRGCEVLFEAKLRDAGIRPFTGRPFHPQTTGKVERFQQTLKQWLRKQPLAADIDELQHQLDRFRHIYNFERPHQGIGRVTPHSRWIASPASQPASEPLEHPVFASRRQHFHSATITKTGIAYIGDYEIYIGTAWAGQQATAITDDHYATVFINNTLIRHLKLDHTRRYQPAQRPHNRPRQRPLG
jgi:transposase InsO family protein